MAKAWTIAYWLLMAAFLLAAALNLLHLRNRFLTGHLADLAIPAWLYVLSRNLAQKRPSSLALMRWVGRTPERAAAFFFLASSLTELSQLFWPRGLFAGVFDPWDIVVFAVGLSVCYGFDKLQLGRMAAGAGDRAPHSSED